ncbi:hypothetical protein ACFWBC_13815 [Streptomyces sp. NPDC059985]|uniref:hypothetical protein n=1 Tax=Streptomyces sp. NPDC059985 TaxID=3347025 RepID=UPI0036B6DF44
MKLRLFAVLAAVGATLAPVSTATAAPFPEDGSIKIESYGLNTTDPRNCVAVARNRFDTDRYDVAPRVCKAGDKRQQWRWNKETGQLSPLSHPKRCIGTYTAPNGTEFLELVMCGTGPAGSQHWERGMANHHGDLIYGPEREINDDEFGGTLTVRSRLDCNWKNTDDAICGMRMNDDAPQDRFRISTW